MNNQEILSLLNKLESSKNVTKNLLNQTNSFVEYVQEKMDDFGIDSLLDGKYVIKKMSSSGLSSEDLYLKVGINDYYEDVYVLIGSTYISATRDTKCMYGQFHMTYNLPNRNDILTLISDVDDILIELANCCREIHSPGIFDLFSKNNLSI